MKIVIASDIHGSYDYLKKLCNIIKKEKPDKLVLLGDILYHGVRNNLPKEYNPMLVFETLNAMKDTIIAVRGNCDSEVDQAVLEFPISDDYKVIEVDGINWYLSHGHINDRFTVGQNDILLNGHTHTYELSRNYINPGSVGIPRSNSEHTCIVYENKKFTLYDLDNSKIDSLNI